MNATSNKCLPIECKDPCLQCSNSTNISNQCVNCKIGYYLDNYTCKKCMDGCDQCDFSDYCRICKPGFYLEKDYTCQPCTFPCLTCTGPNQLTDCKSCADNYKLYDWYGACGFVGECDYPCLTCPLAPDRCGQCMDTFVKVNGTCVNCPTGCKTCDTDLTCTECQDGFFMNTKTLQCEKCAM